MDFGKIWDASKVPISLIIILGILNLLLLLLNINTFFGYIDGPPTSMAFYLLNPILLAWVGFQVAKNASADVANGAKIGAFVGAICGGINTLYSSITIFTLPSSSIFNAYIALFTLVIFAFIGAMVGAVCGAIGVFVANKLGVSTTMKKQPSISADLLSKPNQATTGEKEQGWFERRMKDILGFAVVLFILALFRNTIDFSLPALIGEVLGALISSMVLIGLWDLFGFTASSIKKKLDGN